MKKLMVAAAIVCAAVISQGATVAWSSSMNAIDSKGNVLQANPEPLTISLVLLGTGVTDLGTFEADWSKAVAVQDATWTVSLNTKKGTWSAKGSGTFGGSAEHAIAVGDVYAVMLNDGGTLSQLTYGDGTLDNQMVLVTKAGASDQTAFANFATANYVVEASDVPEPTSAMLLLLGVAGLALRRKQK